MAQRHCRIPEGRGLRERVSEKSSRTGRFQRVEQVLLGEGGEGTGFGNAGRHDIWGKYVPRATTEERIQRQKIGANGKRSSLMILESVEAYFKKGMERRNPAPLKRDNK